MALAEKVGKKGMILAIDMDPLAIENAREKIKEREFNNIKIVLSNFKDVREVAQRDLGPEIKFDGIIFDLGLSMAQLQDSKRGFSFKADTLLDMSFDGDKEKGEYSRAGYIVNNYDLSELCKVFQELGEERLSPRIAKNIIECRRQKPIETTGELEEAIDRAIPGRFRPHQNNIKARIFQALRIKVNEELENLEQALPEAVGLLKKGGRVAVVSYHSLEDRVVKNYFRQESKDCLCPPQNWNCDCGHVAKLKVLTKKVIFPTKEEIEFNPKARSAKLRAAEKI
jgi:16S rRNA (cytosine1402-N4)-methyltransferase